MVLQSAGGRDGHGELPEALSRVGAQPNLLPPGQRVAPGNEVRSVRGRRRDHPRTRRPLEETVQQCATDIGSVQPRLEGTALAWPPCTLRNERAYLAALARMPTAAWACTASGIVLLACLFLSGGTARAQPTPPASSVDPAGADSTAEELAQESPRASLAAFFELCRAGQYQGAAGYLELPAALAARGPELARRLKAVLDRHAWVDFEQVSALPQGDLQDGLPAAVEEIARISGEAAAARVQLVRRDRGGRWVFSRSTVMHIDGWYQALEQRWLLDRLPAILLRLGPADFLYWQLLALLALLPVVWGIGLVVSRLTRRALARLVTRTAASWDDALLARIGAPLTFLWALALTYVAVPWLGLYQPADTFVDRWRRAIFLLVVFWSLARAIDVARVVVASSAWATCHSSSRSMLSLGARVGKVLVLAIGAVALLSELGYPVASLIAGLGVGGLAVALAAQKTVENLFGAFSIGADQPFREGDFVRIEDFVGTVEVIGMRSTKVRTLDRTLISIPNGRLAEMRLESLTARDRLRLACIIGLVYETTAAQMREVLARLERVLREHPKIWPDTVVVRFQALGASSLDIELMAWFETADWSEFQLIRQEVLLQFMEVVEAAGSSFAFPTQTVHLMPGSLHRKAAAVGAERAAPTTHTTGG